MKVAIIGTGLIGGSLALALKRAGFATTVLGMDKNSEHLKKALDLKIIDSSATISEVCKSADLIILTIPVDAICKILPEVLSSISEQTTVVDMGSTKAKICESVKNHPKRANFVASHPIAGTEYTGPEAAIVDLFQDKKTIICQQEKSSKIALNLVKNMYELLEMKIELMDPATHDLQIAYVSHLSHISAFSLGLTVLAEEKKDKNIFKMAGGGFSSTVRLAKSSANMWAPIFDQNAQNISQALGEYIKHLELFKKAIDQGDQSKTRELMEKAGVIRTKM